MIMTMGYSLSIAKPSRPPPPLPAPNKAVFGVAASIRFLQPHLKPQGAVTRAKIVTKYAHARDLDWKTIVAIAFAESSFLWRYGDKECGVAYNGNNVCVYKSLGEMQVYYPVWKRVYNIDGSRMISDLDYQYNIGTRILSRMKAKYAHLDKHWQGRYHSLTYKIRTRYYRKLQHIIGKFREINQ